jgi:hypothetical protein
VRSTDRTPESRPHRNDRNDRLTRTLPAVDEDLDRGDLDRDATDRDATDVEPLSPAEVAAFLEAELEGGLGTADPLHPGHRGGTEADLAHVTTRVKGQRGLAAAALAGAMLGLREVLDPPKDDVAVVVEASGEPGDIDAEGITVPTVDGRMVAAPPQAPWVPLKADPRRPVL